jgi:hypothetical protein
MNAGAHETVLFPAKLVFREAILIMELPKRRATSLPFEAAQANADSEARLLARACRLEAPTRRLQIRPGATLGQVHYSAEVQGQSN